MIDLKEAKTASFRLRWWAEHGGADAPEEFKQFARLIDAMAEELVRLREALRMLKEYQETRNSATDGKT